MPARPGSVSFVLGMDSDGRVPQHGFGPGGRDDETLSRIVRRRIPDAPQPSVHLLMLDLHVRKGRPASRAPVHQPLAPVDQPLLIQGDEGLPDGARQALVQREAFAVPIARGAQPPKLVQDASAVFLAPFPDPFDERLAAESGAVGPFLRQGALDDVLRGDPGVVGPGDPDGVEPLHPLPPGQDVLEGVVQRVAHVERAGDIGRGDDDRESGTLGEVFPPEGAAFPPPIEPPGLGGVRFIPLRQHRGSGPLFEA